MKAATQNSIRILVVDDHHVMRMGLVAVLETEPDLKVIAECGDGRSAVELFRTHQPDVVLLDLRMPDMGGVEALRAIRAESPDARVVVLTTHDGDGDIHRALEAGARAYVLKTTPPSDIIKALRAVHAGQRFLPPEVSARLAERFGTEDLTPRETDVLQLVVKGRSNKEIGAALNLTEGTVKIHMTHLFGKLGVSDRTQAATTALRRGLVHLE